MGLLASDQFEEEEFAAVGGQAIADGLGIGGCHHVSEGLGQGFADAEAFAFGFDEGDPELFVENEDIDASANAFFCFLGTVFFRSDSPLKAHVACILEITKGIYKNLLNARITSFHHSLAGQCNRVTELRQLKSLSTFICDLNHAKAID